MTIAEALRAALAAMNDSGKHWHQGDYVIYLDDDEPSFCAVGAINYVTGGNAENWNDTETRATIVALDGVIKAEVAPTRSNPESWNEFDYAIDRVIRWNDDSERTWEEIVAKFNEAAIKAEAQ
jgi:hypothetical protein